jgi:branched-chain amino acid transport system permease protein
MEAFIAYFEAGIVSGAIYSLIGIGMNLLLVVSNVVQFAYGEIVVISMYMCWLTLKATGSYALAFTIPLITSMALSLLVEPLLRGLRARKLRTETLVITIAVGLILTETMAVFLNSGLPIAFPAKIVGGGWDTGFGLIRVSAADIYVVTAAVGLMLALLYFLFKTRHGKGLRAIAHNIEAARLLGIPLRRETILSFLIAGFLSGVTAILFVFTIGVATPELGQLVTFKGLAVMMLGGMGSLKGAVFGGLLLGLIECMVRGYFIGDWVDAIAMGCIMIVIIAKPGGLFGEAHGEG